MNENMNENMNDNNKHKHSPLGDVGETLEVGVISTNRQWYLKISKIEKSVSLDHTRNCIQT